MPEGKSSHGKVELNPAPYDLIKYASWDVIGIIARINCKEVCTTPYGTSKVVAMRFPTVDMPNTRHSYLLYRNRLGKILWTCILSERIHITHVGNVLLAHDRVGTGV